MNSPAERAARPFEASADCYDLLNRGKDYAAEADYVAKLIHHHAPGATRILELGCGTGAHAEHLARDGFSVHGVDCSGEMVQRAHARRAALPAAVAARLGFSVGDVRSVRCERGFDVVLSLFHVMSYQTAPEDLAAAYETAAAHLGPGGVFVFDHWYGPAVLTQRPEVRVRRVEDARLAVTRIAEPVMHWQRNVCDVRYEYVVQRRADGALHRFEETHPMRYFFDPELRLVEGVRWTTAAAWAWGTERPPTAADWAAVRVLVRQGPAAG